MTFRYTILTAAARLAQHVAALPGGVVLRNGFRTAQTWLDYQLAQEFKKTLADSALRPLLRRFPRLFYKYQGECLAINLTRKSRLAAMLHHYRWLLTHARADFFSCVLRKQCIWQARHQSQLFSMTLAYPFENDFEGELSVQFRANNVLLYTITLTFVPGHILQLPAETVLLVSRVQGARNFALIRQATRSLCDIAPPALLMQAVYGLAQAFGTSLVVGVSTSQQVYSGKAQLQFDYDTFWQQLGAAPTANGFFELPLSPLVKPLEAVKANHRSRTVRKRHYKQQVQDCVKKYVWEQLRAGASGEVSPPAPADYASRCTVAGLNAGTHTDQYSHSSANGLE